MVAAVTPRRTDVRRLPAKQLRGRPALDGVLDAGRVAHVAVVEDGQPFVLPLAYARHGDVLVLHGSTGSRLFRTLADGAPTCATVTVVDGLVLARSAFEASMHYRSATVLGSCERLVGGDALAALEALSEHVLAGRWADVRPPTQKELAATSVLALPLDEWSVKVSDGWPDDAPEDMDLDVWAGVLPLHEAAGVPVAAPDLPPGTALPAYLR